MSHPAVQEIVAVFGQPVAGNPTQYMMEKAFAQVGLDWRYLTLEVAPEGLADARLIDDQVLDSQSLFTLVTRLEAEFGISVPDDELVPDHFETVGTIADLVRSKQG